MRYELRSTSTRALSSLLRSDNANIFREVAICVACAKMSHVTMSCSVTSVKNRYFFNTQNSMFFVCYHLPTKQLNKEDAITISVKPIV